MIMVFEQTPSEKIDELVTGFFDSRINGTAKVKLLTALRNAMNFAEEMEKGIHNVAEITQNSEVYEIEKYWNTIKLTIKDRMTKS